MLQTLRPRCEYIFDLTISYEDFETQYPYDTYTLHRVFCEGKAPRRVHIDVKRFEVEKIPGIKENDAALFTAWLRKRWMDKDAMLEEFYSKGVGAKLVSSEELSIKIQGLWDYVEDVKRCLIHVTNRALGC